MFNFQLLGILQLLGLANLFARQVDLFNAGSYDQRDKFSKLIKNFLLGIQTLYQAIKFRGINILISKFLINDIVLLHTFILFLNTNRGLYALRLQILFLIPNLNSLIKLPLQDLHFLRRDLTKRILLYTDLAKDLIHTQVAPNLNRFYLFIISTHNSLHPQPFQNPCLLNPNIRPQPLHHIPKGFQFVGRQAILPLKHCYLALQFD